MRKGGSRDPCGSITVYVSVDFDILPLQARLYLALLAGLLALPLKFRDLSVVALTAVITLIFFTFTLFVSNSVLEGLFRVQDDETG